jgi:hypothetical protein
VWSYSGDPADSNNDKVRFLCGQTSTADDVLITDEEVSFWVAEKPNVYHAAAAACDVLANRYSATQPKSEGYGKTRLDWSDRVDNLRRSAKALRQQANLEGVTPYVGGASVSDKQSVDLDSDRVKPAFSIGMTDHPGTDFGSTVGSTA